MRTDNNGSAVLCGFQDVVSADRNQASANKRDIGQSVKRSKFANAIEQEDARLERCVGCPGAAFCAGYAARGGQASNAVKTLRMARRQDHDGPWKLLLDLF